MNCLTFEDAKDAFFLLGPGARFHAERHQVSGKSAKQRPRSIPLSAKSPVLIRRIANDRKVVSPRFDPDDIVGSVLVFIARSHRYQRNDPVRPIVTPG